jgi:polyhydroxyalkanoate synthase
MKKNNEFNTEIFSQNLAESLKRCSALAGEFTNKQHSDGVYVAGLGKAAEAFTEVLSRMASNPTRFFELQLEYYADYMKLLAHTSGKLMGEQSAPVVEPDKKDKRFADEMWQDNALFDFIKQSYLLTSGWMSRTVNELDEGMEAKQSQMVDFYTRQLADAMAPSNFAMMNPEVIKKPLRRMVRIW